MEMTQLVDGDLQFFPTKRLKSEHKSPVNNRNYSDKYVLDQEQGQHSNEENRRRRKREEEGIFREESTEESTEKLKFSLLGLVLRFGDQGKCYDLKLGDFLRAHRRGC